MGKAAATADTVLEGMASVIVLDIVVGTAVDSQADVALESLTLDEDSV